MLRIIGMILMLITGDYNDITYKTTGYFEDDVEVCIVLALREDESLFACTECPEKTAEDGSCVSYEYFD